MNSDTLLLFFFYFPGPVQRTDKQTKAQRSLTDSYLIKMIKTGLRYHMLDITTYNPKSGTLAIQP